jgi:predicted nucleic acid-binding protein
VENRSSSHGKKSQKAHDISGLKKYLGNTDLDIDLDPCEVEMTLVDTSYGSTVFAVAKARKRGETELENLLNLLPKVPMQIDWNGLIYMQTENLKHGINKVGLPDLMIAQNVLQNGLTLFSLDRHFELIGDILPLQLYK